MNSFRIGQTRVEIWRDLAEMSERAAELLIATAREATSEQGVFTLALSGGSTPRALYELLATDAKSSRIEWDKTHLFWTDERSVPPDDSQSNYGMAESALISHVKVPPSHVHRMHGEDEPTRAADAYAVELEEHFGAGDPRFSLVLLGMGDDGHTASLFPDSPALADTSHTVAANYVEKLKAHRLTLTLRTLNAAAMIMFLVSGESKARALSEVFGIEQMKDSPLPARLVRPTKGELIWLVDEPAAQLVNSRY
jgi:6-phosphogluconolactonase